MRIFYKFIEVFKKLNKNVSFKVSMYEWDFLKLIKKNNVYKK